MSATPDPDQLLAELREAAGSPPLPPLTLADAHPSARPGPAGRAVSRARATTLRLLTPILGDLLSQLERDRARTRAEIDALRDRVTALEAERDADR